MKKFFSFFLAVIIVAFSVIPSFAAGPDISVNSTHKEVNKDDTIKITVLFNPNTEIMC